MVHVLLELVWSCGGAGGVVVSAEIGGHWVARVEALVPPVYSADAATSSTTHPHSPPTTPIRDPRPQTHLTHTHTLAHMCVYVQKKVGILWNFSCDSSSPRCGSEEWPQGQIVENWAKVLQEQTFHLLSHIGG